MSLSRMVLAAQARSRAEGAVEERAACAELAREAGCLCIQLHAFLGESTGIRLSQVSQIDSVVDVHDSRCPHALAERIEARGRA